MKELLEGESGQALVEYGIIVACVVVAAIGSIQVLSLLFSEKFAQQSEALRLAK